MKRGRRKHAKRQSLYNRLGFRITRNSSPPSLRWWTWHFKDQNWRFQQAGLAAAGSAAASAASDSGSPQSQGTEPA